MITACGAVMVGKHWLTEGWKASVVDYTANSVDFSVLSLYLEYYDIFCFMASFERSTDFEQNCMYSPSKLARKTGLDLYAVGI